MPSLCADNATLGQGRQSGPRYTLAKIVQECDNPQYGGRLCLPLWDYEGLTVLAKAKGKKGNNRRLLRGDGGAQAAPRAGLIARLRNYLLTGVLVTAPVSITIWLTYEFITFVDNRIKPLVPLKWNPETYLPFSVPGLGLLFVLIFLILVGMFAAGFLGRMMMRQGERIVNAVPILRSVYSATKQVFETILADKSQAFRQVGLVEYPSRGTWAVGFVSGPARGEVQRLTKEHLVSVFIPATPNPTTGFLLFLPEQEIDILDMTVEEGLKLVISGGIVTPERQRQERAAAPAAEPEEVAEPVRLKPGLFARLRNYLLAGTLVTAPIAITVWLAWQLITFIDRQVQQVIPATWNPESYLPFGLPGLGVAILILVLILVGMVTAGLVGRWVVRITNWVMGKVPVARSIYGAVRQLLETVFSHKSNAFRECVLFQYPRKDSWAIGFITGRTEGQMQSLTEEEVVNVFLPTTPNPTSGFLLFVPIDQTIPLTMSVEEGLKLVVSGGLVVPPDPAGGEGADSPSGKEEDSHDVVRRLAGL